MKLVSVIIPTYNGFNHIKNAVQSVLNQDYPNIEVIIVDDNGEGSPSQILTEVALKIFLEKDNVHYIKHKNNKNGSAARNTGVGHSNGEYLIFLDDDDEFGDDKISFQAEQLNALSEEFGISYSSRKIMHKGIFKKNVVATHSGNILYEYLTNTATMGTGSVLMRRIVWEKTGGYDESYQRHQDREFFSRILDEYKAIAAPDVYFIRNYTFRNSTDDPIKLEQFAIKHINGIKRLKSLSVTEKEEIEAIYMNNIANKYLRKFKLKKFWILQKKYNDGIKGLPDKVLEVLRWIIAKSKRENFT